MKYEKEIRAKVFKDTNYLSETNWGEDKSL